MSPDLHVTLAGERTHDLLRHADARRRAAGPRRRRSWLATSVLAVLRRDRSARGALPAHANVRLRYGGAADVDAIARLAALDSAAVPTPPVLLAEVDGEAWAALSLFDGHVVADPFRPTAQLIDLLAVRAVHLQAGSDAPDGGDRTRAPGRLRLAAGTGDSPTAA